MSYAQAVKMARSDYELSLGHKLTPFRKVDAPPESDAYGSSEATCACGLKIILTLDGHRMVLGENGSCPLKR
jgi:hypothetical protein